MMCGKISNAIESEITDIQAYNTEVDKSNIEIEELRAVKQRLLNSL